MSRRAGLKTQRHAWADPFRRPRHKASVVAMPVLTPEQIKQRRLEGDQKIAAFIERQTADFQAFVLSVHPKIADREARVAVEGDTDLNHDNIEAAE